MKELTVLGPNQDKVATLLKGGRMSTRGLARSIYGEQPTRSQTEMVRRALRSLENHEFVRLTNFIWERQRCWELTGKLIFPEKKKPTGLSVIK